MSEDEIREKMQEVPLPDKPKPSIFLGALVFAGGILLTAGVACLVLENFSDVTRIIAAVIGTMLTLYYTVKVPLNDFKECLANYEFSKRNPDAYRRKVVLERKKEEERRQQETAQKALRKRRQREADAKVMQEDDPIAAAIVINEELHRTGHDDWLWGK